jgi:hypothetical protein
VVSTIATAIFERVWVIVSGAGEVGHQLDFGETAALQSSVENHLFCRQKYQWNATQNNFLQLTLQPIAFSDRELAAAFYSGVGVV